MFPFVFNENVKEVNNALVKRGTWEYKQFHPEESTENYNEYIYFYEYVRKALYSKKEMKEEQTSYYFEYNEQKGKYILTVSDKEYTLAIDGISMRTFNTKVGILSIELLNYDYADAEDILVINEFSRRLYPQFLGKENGLEEVKNNLLPQSVALEIAAIKIKEDFIYYADMENISKDVTNLPNYIHTLLGKGFSSHNETNSIHIEPIIDDRMFVMSMYINDELSNQMYLSDIKTKLYTYENDDYWYKYIFVDTKDKMCQSRHMTAKLIGDTTYDRWVEWGTLFGISRYSFVALTTDWFGNNRLKPHMHTMYFQIFSLLLAYRASMLNFSTRISLLRLGEIELTELQSEVTEIYKDYINFENNLFFRELTAQEQGIEIYNQALKVMQIEKHIKDLDSEIAELHNYVAMRVSQKQVEQAEKRENELAHISKLGAIFLPPTVIAGIFGVNTIDFAKDTWSMYLSGLIIILSAFLGYGTVKCKSIGRTISIIALTCCVISALFFMPKVKDDTKSSVSMHEQIQSDIKEKK